MCGGLGKGAGGEALGGGAVGGRDGHRDPADRRVGANLPLQEAFPFGPSNSTPQNLGVHGIEDLGTWIPQKIKSITKSNNEPQVFN